MKETQEDQEGRKKFSSFGVLLNMKSIERGFFPEVCFGLRKCYENRPTFLLFPDFL